MRDGVFALSERISPQVEKLISSHAVDDVELPSRYLPQQGDAGNGATNEEIARSGHDCRRRST